MITVTLEGSTWDELAAMADGMFGPTIIGIRQADVTMPKGKGGRTPKEKPPTVEQEPLQSAPTPVVEASKPDLFAPAPPPAPAPVATLEEASAALKAIVNTAGMGMPKASAIMEKVTGKKLFREVTPDQYGALVAACKEAMK